MKLFLMSLILCTALMPFSVSAQDTSDFGGQDMPRFGLGIDTDAPAQILGELVERGMAFLQDHVEITKRYRETRTGDEIRAELDVKLFPEGKGRSEKALEGNSSFELSRHDGELHLRFNLNLSPGHGDRRLEDYL